VLAGCATPYVMTPPPGGYPAVAPIDLRVGLVLTDELRTASVTAQQESGDAGRYFLGPVFAEGTETVCREVFTEVVVGRTPPSGVELLVIPRVVSMRTTRPMGAADIVPLTVVLEWKVVTPRERLVWFEAVRSTASRPAGFAFPFLGTKLRNTIERLDAVFQHLFLQSHGALASSPEIRAYAAEVSLAGGSEE
jgi:hypothetical protein